MRRPFRAEDLGTARRARRSEATRTRPPEPSRTCGSRDRRGSALPALGRGGCRPRAPPRPRRARARQAGRDASRAAPRTGCGERRRRRCTRRAARRRRGRLPGPLLAQDLLDAFRDVAPAASARARGEQPAPLLLTEVTLDRLAGELGDRQPPPPGLEA